MKTLLRRGIRIVNHCKLSDALESIEEFGNLTNVCIFDEDGVLCFENKEYRVNEGFLRQLLSDNDGSADSRNEGKRLEVDIDLDEGKESVLPCNEQCEKSPSWIVSYSLTPQSHTFLNKHSFWSELLKVECVTRCSPTYLHWSAEADRNNKAHHVLKTS